MATLAIVGHRTRSKEIIQLLEMLGGKNSNNLKAISKSYFYYIKDAIINNICYLEMVFTTEDFKIYTLEEFEKKFPYRVGDKVIYEDKRREITKMVWEEQTNTIAYKLDDKLYCNVIDDLQPYQGNKCLQEYKEYLDNIAREKLDKTMEEIEIALAPFKVGDKVIVKGYEEMGEDEIICVFKTYDGDIKYKTKNHLDTHYFMEDSLTRVEKSNKEENMEKRLEPVYELGTGKILYYVEKVSGEKYCPIGETTLYIQDGYEFRDETNNVINAKRITLVRKQPQYPKSYKECCEVIGYEPDEDEISCYQGHLIESFVKLLICRDAYRKIAGEQMGLDKPWKPDWLNKEQDKFVLYTHNNVICSNRFGLGHNVLAFPTEEMRNAFYENFKDLINECKELL